MFFYIEKAYAMERLLIKLNKLGIGGRMYNWVLDFLFDRTIEVRVGKDFSGMHPVENGTPQGSVCSTLLFNIMINDIFEEIDHNIGKSLYADDGALWIGGRNVEYMQKKMQTVIIAVEKWSHKWGFKISATKSQVICFAKKIVFKLNDQELEQVRVIRFLGVLLDEKLTWKQQIDKIKLECKKINNVFPVAFL